MVSEPTSPELVLVSPPEVARQAREQLPDPSVQYAPESPIEGAGAAEELDVMRRVPAPYPRLASAEEPLPRTRRRFKARLAFALLVGLALAAGIILAPVRIFHGGVSKWRSLDGSSNNLAHPTWGRIGTPYLRVTQAAYADGIAAMEKGPPARYISNRIFNDLGQNLFSENGISQLGWVWGQFLDHSFGLRNEHRGETAAIPFDAKDPIERFRNDLRSIDFARTPAAVGTGKTSTRQQTNTVSSFIDAYAVYGGTQDRLEWLRLGPVDGKISNNSASLFLPGGYLPQADARGNKNTAPGMDLMGQLATHPASAAVAGDVRANENIALTATHTLFAREHNRIVSRLPDSLSNQDRFQIARRVAVAEQQYITYHEFLPTLGVHLPPYRGYDPNVNPSLSNEFATVGYRVHSMVHGEIEPAAPVGTYGQAQLRAFRAQGIPSEIRGKNVTLVIPLGVAFGNPNLLKSVGLGPTIEGLADERQYKNDEQIDDSMRSILFQIPKPGIKDPTVCGEPKVNPSCYSTVQDLGAIDVQRDRDHGIPPYNQLRVAYGLEPKDSYRAITGERSAEFPRSKLINRRDPIDDPDILDFTKLKDDGGDTVPLNEDEAQETAVTGVRRSALAARLKAVYGPGNVNKVDAFVGMLSEPHVRGTEFGELQLAMWKKQFATLRDGDRFFYLNDPMLDSIKEKYGIDYRHSLADIIEMNTDADVRPNVFKTPTEDEQG
jgi:hypothetical protein